MTKLKPVWRMNTGNGVPSDLGGSSMYFDGEVLDVHPFDRANSIVWDIIDRDSNEMCAYQTNRTKAAKYERVECEPCVGTGSNIFYACKKCNGTGRMARRIT